MLDIIYEDNHLLALLKPSGLATMGLPEGEATLLTLAKKYIKHKYNKPGEVYLGVVSRLDVPVSGVVLFARTSKAAARLNEQFRNHTVEKIYLAVVEGAIFPAEGDLVGNICEDKRHRKVKLTDDDSGKESRLRYCVLGRVGANSLIEVDLLTGRKHQIRAQLAAHGFPILGDIKYGAKNKFAPNINHKNKNKREFVLQKNKNKNSCIALHAYRLSVDHPITGNRITFETPHPLLSRELPQILSLRKSERTC
ncbi:MAG: RluA family pseudouridine synthase [Planctomycetaceae bacterium]|jgi:23S rRNA pseudouridine1911/1915/1917 synthase|nr:RluA family pseudouridine synthase [Planctomycetaceae bacterium]